MKIQPILTRQEMQALDKYSIDELGISGLALMECAALKICEEIKKRFSNGKILVVTEGGNNGGDGLAAARRLNDMGFRVEIYDINAISHKSDSFIKQKKTVEKIGMPFLKEFPKKMQNEYDIVLDGIFGVGLSRAVTGVHYSIIDQINHMKAYKVAIDIPSGLNANTGYPENIALKADLTITFGYLKTGLVLYPGADYAGEVVVSPIGFPKKALDSTGYGMYTLYDFPFEDYPKRWKDSNKGTYGKILVIAGSKGMAGAAYFASKAVYMTGCGLVKIITHEDNRATLQQLIPEAIVVSYKSSEEAENIVKNEISWADAVLIGPGIGRNETAEKMLSSLFKYAKQGLPVVVDADAVYLSGRHREWINDAKAEIIITPHIKEMSYYMGENIEKIKENPLGFAKQAIENTTITCVLKDARTIVAKKKERAYINIKGNHGMAVGGSGDVLAGCIVGIAGQKKDAYLSSVLGVMLHSLAGDIMRAEKGAYALSPIDLIDGIGRVLGGYDNGQLQKSLCEN